MVAIDAAGREPLKKRFGHQPNQMGSRLVGKPEFHEEAVPSNPGAAAAGTRLQEVAASQALAELREFSFAEDGEPNGDGAPGATTK